MEKLDFMICLKERGWTFEQAKAFTCLFKPIGTTEEMDRFLSLAEEKDLSREDLALILRSIKLKHTIWGRNRK